MCHWPPDHCSAWSFTPTVGYERIGLASADQSMDAGGVPTMQSWSCPGATVAAPGRAGSGRHLADRRSGHAPSPLRGRGVARRHATADWGTMQSIELTVDASRQRIIDLTNELERFCAELGDGLVNVFVPHATAGVALMETGSGSDSDLLGRAGAPPAPGRPLPARPRIARARRRPPAARTGQPVGDVARARGPGRPRDLAVGGAGGPERGQPPPARPLQLRALARRLRRQGGSICVSSSWHRDDSSRVGSLIRRSVSIWRSPEPARRPRAVE